MGISKLTPVACTDGKMASSALAAASALGCPPWRQSWNTNRLCLTGLLKDTRDESTKVMVCIPQASNVLATTQPRVPAPAA
jgi:hypothetical protein